MERVFANYTKQSTLEGLEEACGELVIYLRSLISEQRSNTQLVDIVLLSHLASVSTDCGAIVMLAFDHKKSRFVVVKEYLHEDGKWQLPKHVLRQLQTSCRLYEASTSVACLQPCLDVQITENRTHIIFPYYPLTFDALFGLNRKPPYGFALEKTIELLRAVERLHDANIAHRDIKGPNICFDKRGCLVLIDFDSSVADDLGHRRTVPVCTLLTRAPEQLRAELVKGEAKTSYDAKAGDWWAVGCVIVQMFLGVPLFELPKQIYLQEFYEDMCMLCAQFAQWQTSIHERVKTLRRCVTPHIMVLLSNLLSLQPEKRHSGMLDFLQAYS